MSFAFCRLVLSFGARTSLLARPLQATAVRTLRATAIVAEENSWYKDFDSKSYQDKRKSFDSQQPYQRRAGDNGTIDDMATVTRLLAKRDQARQAGDFESADACRDELLKEHGVRVQDGDRTWWHSKPRPTKETHGPLGHDYELDPTAGPNQSGWSDQEIHERLAERLQYKLEQKFNDADEIQEELRNRGVFIHDRSRQWRADGKNFVANQGGGRGGGGGRGREPNAGSRGNSGGAWVYRQAKNSASTKHVAEIEDLLEKRCYAKMDRNFTLADQYRDELREEYNVSVDDREKEWSVGKTSQAGRSFPRRR